MTLSFNWIYGSLPFAVLVNSSACLQLFKDNECAPMFQKRWSSSEEIAFKPGSNSESNSESNRESNREPSKRPSYDVVSRDSSLGSLSQEPAGESLLSCSISDSALYIIALPDNRAIR